MGPLDKLKEFSAPLLKKFEDIEKSAKDKRESLFGEVMTEKETAEKSGDIEDKYKEKRHSLFGEVFESMLARYFPNVSKFMDISTSVIPFTSKDDEIFAWQNEFETITAFTVLVPDFLLRKITDPIAESETFLKVLSHWPLKGEDFANDIKSTKNPDTVINALRLMHQDLATSKVSFTDIKSWFSK